MPSSDGLFIRQDHVGVCALGSLSSSCRAPPTPGGGACAAARYSVLSDCRFATRCMDSNRFRERHAASSGRPYGAMPD